MLREVRASVAVREAERWLLPNELLGAEQPETTRRLLLLNGWLIQHFDKDSLGTVGGRVERHSSARYSAPLGIIAALSTDWIWIGRKKESRKSIGSQRKSISKFVCSQDYWRGRNRRHFNIDSELDFKTNYDQNSLLLLLLLLGNDWVGHKNSRPN